MLGLVTVLVAFLTTSVAQTNLPDYVTPARLGPGGFPWGDSYSQVRWQDSPDTGDVRQYDFTVSRSSVNIDGVDAPALLVNNQFPGPLIEANWGDTIQVTLHNNITGPGEGTGIHWHGLYQHDTPFYDGIPSVDQCPIPPGSSLTYTFKADQYGSSWWHSHYDAQFASGLYGAMIIHGPKTAPYDIDLGAVLISDHYHQGYDYYLKEILHVPFEVNWNDNNLINGKTAFQYNCPTAGQNCTDYSKMETFQFTPGKVHRLRLVHTGATGVQRFAIDGHTMTVIAEDLTPIQPYETDLVVLGTGQRTDILVTGTAAANSSWFMRADQHDIPSFCGSSFQIHALAGIYYPSADTSQPPTSTPPASLNDYNIDFCQNTPLEKTVPLFPKPPPAQPSVIQQYDISVAANESGVTLFYVNAVSFRANYNHPLLLLSKLGNNSYPDDPQWNVYNFGSNSSIRMFVNNTTPFAHPIHLHGHNFWVLAAGRGEWDGSIAENPIRRDVQIVQPATRDGSEYGYIVLEWEQDNPGVWPFHCHIAWHAGMGLYINVVEQPDEIAKMNIPADSAQTCRDWWTWTDSNVVDQIDSGL